MIHGKHSANHLDSAPAQKTHDTYPHAPLSDMLEARTMRMFA
ncbi:MAG: hypothetical protein OJF49_004391 [Ktedonobacterales bacterium]|nr:MAG: hypothetical protein OJF49_004391 [Ktedonobacterales bacterium]